jgi:hypothetical protein
MTDKAEDPRVTRARLSGPEQVAKNATAAEISADGTMIVLVQGKPRPTNNSARNDLHALRRHAEKQHQSCGQNKSRNSNRPALDGHLAIRCCGKRPSNHGSRQRRMGDVCGNPLLVSARLW